MAATSTTSSSDCSTYFHTRGNDVEASRRVGAPSNQLGCAKVDGVAMWLMNGVANAFFASLQRCSCIRIATVDDHEEDSNDLPLIFNDGNLRHPGNTTTSWRKRNKGKKGSTAFLEE
ncbi:hypothetical protein L1887_44481 [Cichorium endivia]|nr:hypothetical protein L1887_44481 [Cichorium endivia]